MGKVLEIHDLNVTYKTGHKQIFAVKEAAFSIDKGDSLGVVGESGSGKSTLAMAILRLLPESVAEIQGQINFLSADLLKLNKEEMREYRWNKLSVVFQKAMNSFSPVHRIGEQIEDIYKVHKPRATKKEIGERIKVLFDLVNLGDRIYRLYPHELSGGMLQRVSIAVSLLHEPICLFWMRLPQH